MREFYPFQTPYHFANNNPTMYSDPSGMATQLEADLKKYEAQNAFWDKQVEEARSKMGFKSLAYESAGSASYGYGGSGSSSQADNGTENDQSLLAQMPESWTQEQKDQTLADLRYNEEHGITYETEVIVGPISWWPDNSGGFGELWNHPLARVMVADFETISIGGMGVAGLGGGMELSATWVTRGPEASIIPIFSISPKVGAGYDISLGIGSNKAWYAGDPNKISRDMVKTMLYDNEHDTYHHPTYFYNFEHTLGLEYGLEATYTPNVEGSFIFGYGVNSGLGLPLPNGIPLNFSAGVSNTFILWDPKK